MGSVAAADSPVTTVTQTLSGLDDVVSGGFEPPDVQVAAGPGYVMEMANLAARTWRTSGGTALELQTQDLAVFFGSGSDRLTDPRIVYDALSGRWFASISDVDRSSVLVAVASSDSIHVRSQLPEFQLMMATALLIPAFCGKHEHNVHWIDSKRQTRNPIHLWNPGQIP